MEVKISSDFLFTLKSLENISVVKITPDGKFIISGGADCMIKIHSIETREFVAEIEEASSN